MKRSWAGIGGRKWRSNEADDEEMERQPRRLGWLVWEFYGERVKSRKRRGRTSEMAPTVIGRPRSDPSQPITHALKDKRQEIMKGSLIP